MIAEKAIWFYLFIIYEHRNGFVDGRQKFVLLNAAQDLVFKMDKLSFFTMKVLQRSPNY